MKCFMTRQDCIYEKEIQQGQSSKSKTSMFMISPFGYPYDEIFQLVSVEYESAVDSQNYDSRRPTGWAIRDIRPLPVDKDRPSEKSPQRAAPPEPFSVSPVAS